MNKAVQIPLTYDVPVQRPEKEFRQPPDQIQALEKLSEQLKAQHQEMLTIVLDLYPGVVVDKLYQLDTEKFSAVCNEWHRRNPRALPELATQSAPAVRTLPKYKPLIPHSEERKQKERRRRLVERSRKAFTLLPFYIDQVQSELAVNPGYYGVCSLPSEFVCKAHIRNLAQERAIARENELRAREAGLEPLTIPLALPDRELVSVGLTQQLKAISDPQHSCDRPCIP